MLNDLIKNYGTATKGKDACEKDWCISPFPGKIQQVQLTLGGRKAYDYACRYPVVDGDVAIVGYALPSSDYHPFKLEASSNTGCIGNVTQVSPKLTVKRNCAVEVDYVFTAEVSKKSVTECLKYLQSGADAYKKTIQLDKHINTIRPITYYIRQILAAASVLAHPKLATSDGLELAKSIIFEDKTVNEAMQNLEHSPGGDIGVDFSDVQVPDPELAGKLDSFASTIDNPRLFEEGTLENDSRCLAVALSSDLIANHVKKYPHFGAVSVMIRGGFKNLLEAYLSVNPPIDDYYDEMCQKLEGIGHEEVYAVLKAYKK